MSEPLNEVPVMSDAALNDAVRDLSNFVDGYLAAWRDLSGMHTSDRSTIILADKVGAALNAYSFPGWLDRLVPDELPPVPRAPKKPPRRGWVYAFIDRKRRLVKVGFTAGLVARRKRSIESGANCELAVLGSMPGTCVDEQRLHEQLARFRENGEWFRADPEVLNVLEEALS